MGRRPPRQLSQEKAIESIQSGDTVILGTGCAEPQTLVEEMIHQRERLRSVRLLTMVPAGRCDYAAPGMESHFRVMTFVASAGLLEAMKAGRCDYIPTPLSGVPRLFRDGYIEPDVALIQVTPPDERGFCSLGISVDYLKIAVEKARIVVAEVNDRMPCTRGDSAIHISEIDVLVESSRPLLTLERSAHFSEIVTTLGRNVAELVPEGATIEVGIGAIPSAVLRTLENKRHLHIHTGIITDSVVGLYRSGAIDISNSERPPVVATLAMGSESLYDFLRESSVVEMHQCTYTNDVSVLASIPRFVAVNSALQVDLTGQINAEVIGGLQVSGVGGQTDFMRGAALAPHGKSIIVLPSSANGGTISRIVPRLDDKAVVTTTRADVHYVVTEYGVADLRGKPLKERARALAAIAHPHFRDELLKRL